MAKCSGCDQRLVAGFHFKHECILQHCIASNMYYYVRITPRNVLYGMSRKIQDMLRGHGTVNLRESNASASSKQRSKVETEEKHARFRHHCRHVTTRSIRLVMVRYRRTREADADSPCGGQGGRLNSGDLRARRSALKPRIARYGRGCVTVERLSYRCRSSHDASTQRVRVVRPV